VAILDADKEGFLRSTRSLIQTCGRAARHLHGMVILYADSVTPSMQQAIDETARRRKIQQAHNEAHRITPESVQKAVTEVFDFGTGPPVSRLNQVAEEVADYGSLDDLDADIRRMEKQMRQAAKELDFERAAELRDRIRELQKLIVLEA
jgi:excinuclease ABC subunit B